VAAQSTPVRQQNPVQRLFDGVPDANASKLHGPAVWTLWREHERTPPAYGNTGAERAATVVEPARPLPAFRWSVCVAAFSSAQPRP
jgi:hypothetical protein